VKHLKSRNISAARVKTLGEIAPIRAAPKPKPPEERVTAVIDRLRQMNSSKPRKLKALRSTIASVFNKQLSVAELDSLVGELEAREILTLGANEVSYSL
jgi:hypothetical protein